MTYEFYHIVEFWREWTHQPILRQDRNKRWNTPCILANIGTLPWCLRKTMASAPFPEQHVKGWQHNVVSCWWGWDHARQTIFQQISFQFKETKKYLKKYLALPCDSSLFVSSSTYSHEAHSPFTTTLSVRSIIRLLIANSLPVVALFWGKFDRRRAF